MIMPNPQGNTAPPGSTLKRIANRLLRAHSNFGMTPRAASESSNGKQRNRQAAVVIALGGWHSDAAQTSGTRCRTAAAFDDALATVEGGAAVVAVMAGNVVPVAAGINRRKPTGGIAEDGG